MKLKSRLQTIALFAAIWFVTSCTEQQPQPKITKIAFGSCATQEIENKMWPAIQNHSPDVFVWLGDNIYGDSEDPQVLFDKYKTQKDQPAYQAFLQTGVQIMGTWDDHDYGVNDGGKEYPSKQKSKDALLWFLDVEETADVRQHDGVYQSYTIGKEGNRVKVILLDTRWFRDSLAPDTTGHGRYVPSNVGSMLGKAQWVWLEKELAESTAQVHVIGSSIQAISEEHGWEKWGNFPHELERLYNVINQSGKPTVIISGDRHMAELSKRDLPNGMPVYDATSSGMTHVYVRDEVEPNQYRISPYIMKLNWGLVSVDWAGEQPKINLEIRGVADSLHYEKTLEF